MITKHQVFLLLSNEDISNADIIKKIMRFTKRSESTSCALDIAKNILEQHESGNEIIVRDPLTKIEQKLIIKKCK